MGSWNGTCGLTGLPIFEDDPVIAMVIQNESHPRQNFVIHYPYDLWSPASLIVRGTYDDVGGVTLADEERAKLSLTVEESRRYFKRHENDGLSVEKYDEGFSTDNLFRQKAPFSLWLAHAGIYHDMVASVNFDGPNAQNTEWLSDISIETAVRDEVAYRLEWHARAIEHDMRFASRWCSNSEYYAGAAFRWISNAFDEANKDTDFNPLVAAYADQRSLLCLVNSLRMVLSPTGACGSQDIAFQPYQVRAKTILEWTKNRQEKWRCVDDEDA